MSDKGKETKYELVDIGRLIPYARNARTHSDTQIAQIAASIREFGFLAPIIISGDDTILCGHRSWGWTRCRASGRSTSPRRRRRRT